LKSKSLKSNLRVAITIVLARKKQEHNNQRKVKVKGKRPVWDDQNEIIHSGNGRPHKKRKGLA